MLVQNFFGIYFEKYIFEFVLCSVRECVMELFFDLSCLGILVFVIDKFIFRKYKIYLRLNQVIIVY